MGLVCIQNSSLLVYSKSQKVSASYCLPFQHSRGKNQPVGGFRPPPPACLGLKTNWRIVGVKRQNNISFRAENSAWWKTALRHNFHRRAWKKSLVDNSLGNSYARICCGYISCVVKKISLNLRADNIRRSIQFLKVQSDKCKLD